MADSAPASPDNGVRSSPLTPLRDAVGTLWRSWSNEASTASWSREALAAITVTSMSVPQGVAYALIAGLPPAVGLIAGGLPTIVGSLFRSSRHVIAGPTNALSLLVGTSVAGQFDDPVTAAATLALMVGVLQVLAAVLRLGAAVDYVSTAVVAGYITGAGVLIGVGQLPNLTGTEGIRGDLVTQLVGFVAVLPETHGLTLALGLGTIATIVALRQVVSKSAAALLAVSLGMAVTLVFGLGDRGVMLVSDLATTPRGLSGMLPPDGSLVTRLLPIALAGVLLSLVESTSVARSIAGRSGQRLDLGLELFGMGLANVVSGAFGALPVSGSLSRSALNEQSGARTRFAGALSGALMLGVLLGLGTLVDRLPIASLAGLLVVVAVDLVDVSRIRRLLRATVSDRVAFLATLGGTWVLPLDRAIAVGVAVNLVLFLRQAQALLVRELLVDDTLRLREVELDAVSDGRCAAIRVLHLEGPLFFGAAGALDRALQPIVADSAARFVVVRLKRTRGLDFTTAEVFATVHRRLVRQGRALLMVGMRQPAMDTLERSGVSEALGDHHLYPTRPGWFAAMNEALAFALAHLPADYDASTCPLADYLRHHAPSQIVSSIRYKTTANEISPPPVEAPFTARPRRSVMHIEAFYDEATCSLTYVVSDPVTRDAIIIDPVLDFDPQWVEVTEDSVDRIARYCRDHDLAVHYVLDTHVHADHFSGSQALKARVGAQVGIGRHIAEVQRTSRDVFNRPDDLATDGRQFDVLLDDGQPLHAGSLTITLIHTPACVTYQIGDALFTGDTMFMPDLGNAGSIQPFAVFATQHCDRARRQETEPPLHEADSKESGPPDPDP